MLLANRSKRQAFAEVDRKLRMDVEEQICDQYPKGSFGFTPEQSLSSLATHD